MPAIERLRRDLAPLDRVHVIFYAFVLLLCAVRFPTLPDPAVSIGWHLGALVATLALARALSGRRSGWAVFARAMFTLVTAPITYDMLGDIVPYVNPYHGERLVKAVDNFLFFGSNPNVMLGALESAWATEVLMILYTGYYAVPLILLVTLCASKKFDGLARATFLVLFCLYGSYVGYFLLPTTGPNINELSLYPPYFSSPMKGLWCAESLRAFLLVAETIKHDCWPSGHAALSITCVWICWREKNRIGFWILLFPVIGLIFATMYLRYHYVFDFLSGVLLAWATMKFGPRVYERWRRKDVDPPTLYARPE